MVTIGAPFRVFWQSVKDLFDEMFVLLAANIIWVLISAPLFALVWLLLSSNALILGAATALLAVVPMAPANAGLLVIAERVTDGRSVRISHFFAGFREYLKLSLKVFLPWALGLLLILANIQFYATWNNTIGSFLFVLFLYILAIWFAFAVYIGPLMIIQTNKSLKIIVRNASLMVFGRPVFTLLTVFLMGIIAVLSAWLLILPLLLTFSFFAVWGFRATTRLIKDAEARRAALEEQQSASGPNLSKEKGRGGQVRPRE